MNNKEEVRIGVNRQYGSVTMHREDAVRVGLDFTEPPAELVAEVAAAEAASAETVPAEAVV